MSMSRSLLLASGALMAFGALAESPQLGQPLSQSELETLDYVVMPDGDGLPIGGGDARQGAALYAQHCLACHGSGGQDGINDRLAGGHGTINGARPVKTVGSFWPYSTTVFDYIRRAMPYQSPGSLSADEIYALTAYILYINDIVDEDRRLDAETLPTVKMPNQENFVWAYAPPGSDESK